MENITNLAVTPLIEIHKSLGAKLAPFGGWLMPIQYAGIIEEHNWTRKSASLFDICHMGEFSINAELDSCNLNELFTFDLKSMANRTCKYGAMLNEDGGIIDDVVVYRIDSGRWMAVVNATTIAKDAAHFKKYLKGEFIFEDMSMSIGKLDLQGPSAAAVLSKIIGRKITNLKYYTFDYFKILHEKIIISRTGYTGELGYELYMPNDKIPALWNLLLSDDRVKPAGLGARDTLRLEMGYTLYGQDIADDTTPLESDMARFVDFSKNFTGKTALLRQRSEGIKRHMVSFIADSRRSPRHNYKITRAGEEFGVVTSGTFSPSLGLGIGMGYVKAPLSEGDDILLKDNNINISAKVTKKPFYKNGTARIKELS